MSISGNVDVFRLYSSWSFIITTFSYQLKREKTSSGRRQRVLIMSAHIYSRKSGRLLLNVVERNIWQPNLGISPGTEGIPGPPEGMLTGMTTGGGPGGVTGKMISSISSSGPESESSGRIGERTGIEENEGMGGENLREMDERENEEWLGEG